MKLDNLANTNWSPLEYKPEVTVNIEPNSSILQTDQKYVRVE
jgi:hypothetical protein